MQKSLSNKLTGCCLPVSWLGLYVSKVGRHYSSAATPRAVRVASTWQSSITTKAWSVYIEDGCWSVGDQAALHGLPPSMQPRALGRDFNGIPLRNVPKRKWTAVLIRSSRILIRLDSCSNIDSIWLVFMLNKTDIMSFPSLINDHHWLY